HQPATSLQGQLRDKPQTLSQGARITRQGDRPQCSHRQGVVSESTGQGESVGIWNLKNILIFYVNIQLTKIQRTQAQLGITGGSSSSGRFVGGGSNGSESGGGLGGSHSSDKSNGKMQFTYNVIFKLPASIHR